MRDHGKIKNGLMWGLCLATLGACGEESLTNRGSYPQTMVGARRVAVATSVQSFSDYVFGVDGALTHLRSVTNGQIVDEAQGAGAVRGTDGVACKFGSRWYGLADSILVIDGECTDGAERDIALTLTQVGNAQQNAEPGASWMMPAAWRIQRCDLRSCAD